MPKSLTASDRSSLIKLAHSMEKGSEERKAILAGLKKVAQETAWWAPGKRRGFGVVFGKDRGSWWVQVGEAEPGYGITDPQVDKFRLEGERCSTSWRSTPRWTGI
jgi:hypothetical protein